LDGSEQLVQSGERQMRLRLNTGRREQRHAPRARRSLGLGQQTRLSDAGFSVQHERLAAHGDVVQERRQELVLLEATEERRILVMRRPEHDLPIVPRLRRRRGRSAPAVAVAA
jgi:hypothetical protein